MEQYLDLAKKIIKDGVPKIDRTGTGSLSIFGTQSRFNLQNGFPILTTKKVFLKAVIHELLWFLKGDTNIKYLVDNNVNIWNEWPYENFKKSQNYKNESMTEFINKIKNDKLFSIKYGELGPVYGKQWRDFNGVDQISEAINLIKNSPESRRIIVSAWNPPEIKDMLLPPCHSFFQFYVLDNKLSCQLYQRSADYFLGVPFNICSYALLTMMVAQVTGLSPGDFIHTIGDCHIYKNHLNQINEQISRTPYNLPTIKINKNIISIFDFKYEDFTLENYVFHPAIKALVAV